MSQPGAPGQMGQPQGQPGNRPQGPPMYKAEQMRQMPFLSEEEKLKYEKGLRQLWTIHDNSPDGSQAKMDARKKITDFSLMLRGKLVQRKQGQGAAQQQQQQQDGSQAAASQPAGAPQPTVAPAATAGPATPVQAEAPTGQAPAAAPAAPQGQQQQIPEQIMRHVNQMTFLPTPQVAEKGPEIIQKWQVEMRNRYARGLQQMHTTSEQLKKIESIAAERTQKGNPLSPEENKQFTDRKAALQKAHGEAQRWVENFRKNQEALKNAAGANAGQARPQPNGAGTPAAAGQNVRPGPSPQQPQPAQTNPLQSSQSAVNAAIEAAKNQQLAAANRMPGANGQPGQQPQAPPIATSAAPQASPVTAHPPSAPQAQPIKIEPGTQTHPHPPPVNTAIASAIAAGGLPSAGTPTQNSARALQTPVAATPTSGAPRSLSHQAALTLANQRGSQPPSATVPGQPPQPGQPQATPQGPGGTPASAPSVMSTTSQPGHPHTHPTQQQQAPALTQKLPIPKQLPEKAIQPVQPVSLGGGINAGRPTYSGGSGMAGGVMGQPAVAKIGALQLEGEGERVLNRKKLDELVRQVCGGQAEGQEGNVLTPDVEEVSYKNP